LCGLSLPGFDLPGSILPKLGADRQSSLAVAKTGQTNPKFYAGRDLSSLKPAL
jgi:hypothetical protein